MESKRDSVPHEKSLAQAWISSRDFDKPCGERDMVNFGGRLLSLFLFLFFFGSLEFDSTDVISQFAVVLAGPIKRPCHFNMRVQAGKRGTHSGSVGFFLSAESFSALEILHEIREPCQDIYSTKQYETLSRGLFECFKSGSTLRDRQRWLADKNNNRLSFLVAGHLLRKAGCQQRDLVPKCILWPGEVPINTFRNTEPPPVRLHRKSRNEPDETLGLDWEYSVKFSQEGAAHLSFFSRGRLEGTTKVRPPAA